MSEPKKVIFIFPCGAKVNMFSYKTEPLPPLAPLVVHSTRGNIFAEGFVSDCSKCDNDTAQKHRYANAITRDGHMYRGLEQWTECTPIKVEEEK